MKIKLGHLSITQHELRTCSTLSHQTNFCFLTRKPFIMTVSLYYEWFELPYTVLRMLVFCFSWKWGLLGMLWTRSVHLLYPSGNSWGGTPAPSRMTQPPSSGKTQTSTFLVCRYDLFEPSQSHRQMKWKEKETNNYFLDSYWQGAAPLRQKETKCLCFISCGRLQRKSDVNHEKLDKIREKITSKNTVVCFLLKALHFFKNP